ncbi:hypothetical protein FisN_25Lh189 [Fistulifera solaris]|uniref:NAD-dependent epimerase/dehydratase domain-containing protein n=1 Tax=Fistulifera solaris TaxID=1519565 RepID=A0A1Z5KR08_FISSO|nr:hypothetical protein FisN_25Lh189 [Fistulifera solaris]|eukprot:GAX28754.1 hypothetical protein FisN_25Lh189 [Fistulifera solaris]
MKSKETILWIGGTSGFAQSYFQAFSLTEEWVVVGIEKKKPAWLPGNVTFLSCDLTENSQELTKYMKVDHIDRVIVSIRPPLVTYRTNQQSWKYAQAMLHGLTVLLNSLPSQVRQIVHISSIAAVDHHPRQSMFSEKDDTVSSSQELSNPYDRFKRACEERISHWATSSNPPKSYTHLRFGAIFTDAPACIQCQSLAMQARLGPLLAIPIDCNSGRNAATLLNLILSSPHDKVLQPIYFYCRPLRFSRPASYGTFLQAYREAYNMRYYLTVPDRWVRLFVLGFHALTRWLGSWVPFLESIDYLLIVTLNEHSFDQTLVQKDFPELISREETILQCFERRRRIQ